MEYNVGNGKASTSCRYTGRPLELEYTVVAPGIFVYHNVLPESMNIIRRVEDALAKPGTRFAWKPAGLGYHTLDHDVRKCKDFKIKDDIQTLGQRDEYSSDMYDLYKEIVDVLKGCISHYAPINYLSKIDFFECINVVRYGEGEFFKVHGDDGDPYRCTLSAVGYPNDDYEGGELWFPAFDVKIKPKAGDFAVFPSSYVYSHSSEPVTGSGIKYSLVIMTDRNTFAHRNDSPIYYPVEYRNQFNV